MTTTAAPAAAIASAVAAPIPWAPPVTMATDPVCEMTVERERSVSAERDGETYFFCSRGCRDEFLGGGVR